MVKDVTPSDVKAAMKSTRLLFVDCWAPWCAPCKALGPILDELEEKYQNDSDVAFLKVNTDEHGEYSLENGIYGIPCVLIFMDGKPAKLEIPSSEPGEVSIVDRLVGLRPAEHYEYAISKLLNRN
ncbi:thioredoxin [Candidatus Thorarchaeota archaeon]|nr:MAG: thioredoxin [Candidatus Thorarchaeota archaeon]